MLSHRRAGSCSFAAVALVVTAGSFAPTGLASAQESVTIPATPQCEACPIDVVRSVDLGTASGSGIIEKQASRAVRDKQGRFLLIGTYSTSIKVFDRYGKYLRTAGRKGSGPGEFEGISKVVPLAKDTILAFDQVLARAVCLDGDFNVLRTIKLPLDPELQVLVDSDWIHVALPLATPESAGQPIHVLDRDGHFQRSIGSGTGVFRPDIPWLNRRVIALADSGRIWSAHMNQYRIDLLDSGTGALIRAYTRNASWFPPRLAPVKPGKTESAEPQPLIVNSSQDRVGNLWVMLWIADPTWRRALSPDTPPGDHPTVRDFDTYYDTVLDILDPKSGQLIASQRVDQALTHFISDREVGEVVEDSAGVPKLRTWVIVPRFPLNGGLQ